MGNKQKWEFVEWKFHKNWGTRSFSCSDHNNWLTISRVYLDEDNTTYLTFKEWLPLYNADPSVWFIANYEWSNAKCHICPVCVIEEKLNKKKNNKYIVSEEYVQYNTKKRYQFIIFTNRWSYYRWKRFMTKQGTAKEDIDNLKEYQMLVQYAQKRANERVEETQKQLQAAIDENVKLIGEATKEVLNSNNNNIVIPTTWNFQENSNIGDILALNNVIYVWNDDECKWVEVKG